MQKPPPEVEQHITQIEHRLFVDGRAAIFVGAGFSRGAIPNRPDKSPPPGWWEFAQKLGQRLSLSKDDLERKSVTRIPDEFRAIHGEDVLDQAIRELIADEDYSPSPIHKRLMRLPWADVFTTNYDTLLERAVNKERKYTTVFTTKDLTTAKQPRIVKLHGSLPGHRPFIASDEDFRTYPKNFAPFVNLVQQSLIENSLILIGFSGDDPNFRAWSGWVRDELDKHAPHIYLITLDVDHSSRRYLETKHINVIDLAFATSPKQTTSPDQRFKEAFDWFLARLEQKELDTSPLDWPGLFQTRKTESNSTSTLSQTTISQLFDYQIPENLETWQQKLNQWESIQKNYPGWAVCPNEPRQKIQTGINLWLHESEDWFNAVPTEVELKFAYHLCWWAERGSMPLETSVFLSTKKIWEKYVPFGTPIDEKYHPATHNTKEWNWVLLSNQWLEVGLGLLRSARIFGDQTIFEEIESQLRPNIKRENGFLYDRFQFEVIQFTLRTLQIGKLKQLVNDWDVRSSDPFWMVRKSGIMAELGDAKGALDLCTLALTEIRSRTQDAGTDYLRLSEEGWCLYQIELLELAIQFDQPGRPKPQDGHSDEQNTVKQHASFNRFRTLSVDQCDPKQLVEYAEGQVPDRTIPSVQQRSFQLDDFDPDRVNRSRSISTKPWEDLVRVIAFTEIFPQGGLPSKVLNLSIESDAHERALRHLWTVLPVESVLRAVRSEQKIFVAQHLTRASVLAMQTDHSNELIDTLLEALKQSIPITRLESLDKHPASVLSDRILITALEILSRLTIRMTSEGLKTFFQLLVQIAHLSRVQQYSAFHDPLEHALRRLLFTWDTTHIQKVLVDLLNWPILTEYRNRFAEPFEMKPLSNVTKIWDAPSDLPQALINDLLNKITVAQEEQQWHAIVRLGFLHRIGALTEHQSQDFAELLWKNTPPNQFPNINSLRKTAFLSYPAPDDVDVAQQYKVDLLTRAVPSLRNPDGSYSINQSPTHDFFQELNSIFREDFEGKRPEWTLPEIQQLLSSIREFWTDAMTWMTPDLKQDLGRILISSVSVVFDRLLPLVQIRQDIGQFPLEMIEMLTTHGFDIAHVLPMKLLFLPSESDNVARILEQKLKSPELLEMTLGAYGVARWVHLAKDHQDIPKCPAHLIQLFINTLAVSNTSLETPWNALNMCPEELLKQHPNFFDDLEPVLNRARIYTRIESGDDLTQPPSIGVSWFERPALRARASQVAAKLWQSYQRQNIEIPTVLDEWKSEGTKDLLPEVRQPWADPTHDEE